MTDYIEKQQIFQQWFSHCRRIVFFGGAGISTESGIPDFRSVDGLYHQEYAYPPEVILSHTFFKNKPEQFFHFYRHKMLYPKAEPNAAHLALAAWERQGKLSAVITQNIDGLHQAAGSVNVLELHGSVQRNTCLQCGRTYGLEAILNSVDVPYCICGGIIKPDVVLYEEPLNTLVWKRAECSVREADMLIVGGTSLAVYPAASLLHDYLGDKLVLINRTPTSYDSRASLVIHGSLGEILSAVNMRKQI